MTRGFNIWLGINKSTQRGDAVRQHGDKFAGRNLCGNITDITIGTILHPGKTVIADFKNIDEFAVTNLADFKLAPSTRRGPHRHDAAQTLAQDWFDIIFGLDLIAQRQVSQIGTENIGAGIKRHAKKATSYELLLLERRRKIGNALAKGKKT